MSNKNHIDWSAIALCFMFAIIAASCATCSIVDSQENQKTKRQRIELQALEKQIELEKLRQNR